MKSVMLYNIDESLMLRAYTVLLSAALPSSSDSHKSTQHPRCPCLHYNSQGWIAGSDKAHGQLCPKTGLPKLRCL